MNSPVPYSSYSCQSHCSTFNVTKRTKRNKLWNSGRKRGMEQRKMTTYIFTVHDLILRKQKPQTKKMKILVMKQEWSHEFITGKKKLFEWFFFFFFKLQAFLYDTQKIKFWKLLKKSIKILQHKTKICCSDFKMKFSNKKLFTSRFQEKYFCLLCEIWCIHIYRKKWRKSRSL